MSSLRDEKEAREEVIELLHKEGLKWMDKKSNHCAKKESLRFTTPLLDACQDKDNE